MRADRSVPYRDCQFLVGRRIEQVQLEVQRRRAGEVNLDAFAQRHDRVERRYPLLTCVTRAPAVILGPCKREWLVNKVLNSNS